MCKYGFCIKCFHLLNDFFQFTRFACSRYFLDAADDYIGVAQNLKEIRESLTAVLDSM